VAGRFFFFEFLPRAANRLTTLSLSPLRHFFFFAYNLWLSLGHYCYILCPSHQSSYVGELFITNLGLCFYASKHHGARKQTLNVCLLSCASGWARFVDDWWQIEIPYVNIEHVVKAGIFRMNGFPDITPLNAGVNPKLLIICTSEGHAIYWGGFGPVFDTIYDQIVDGQRAAKLVY